MRKCFGFSADAEGQEHELPDTKSLFDLCDEMRQTGKIGFLVRADNFTEAQKHIDNLPETVRENIETVFIL